MNVETWSLKEIDPYCIRFCKYSSNHALVKLKLNGESRALIVI